MSGVLTRAQALTMMTRHQLYRLVSSGRWARPARGVFVNHTGPLTPAQRDWVALLAAPPGSVLGGLTALAHDGFSSFAPSRPVVVAPMSAAPVSYDDLDLHWSVYLDDRDVHPLRTPPRTRPARSVIDAASWERHERRAREIVLSAAQQGVVTPRTLRGALVRRGTCRHRALIVESYLDALQAVVRRRDGRYYLDVWWEAFNLAVEVHGIPHTDVERWDGDLLRLNEVVIRGRRTLVFSSYAIRRQRPVVVDQLWRSTG
jgi:hypothetical protein